MFHGMTSLHTDENAKSRFDEDAGNAHAGEIVTEMFEHNIHSFSSTCFTRSPCHELSNEE